MQATMISSPKDKLPQFYHNNTAIKTRSISNRLLPILVIFACILSLPIYLFFHHTWTQPIRNPALRPSSQFATPSAQFEHPHGHDDLPQLSELIPASSTVSGGTIMPKMANATAKAELGRATWKFMHTVTARFPEKPTEDEREALKSFLYLFSRLYPCGDCARHFQELLKQYPPQTSSRNVASLHLCSLHNMVNERLGKPEYNCTSLLENYDCGCGADEKDEKHGNTSPIPKGFMIPSF